MGHNNFTFQKIEPHGTLEQWDVMVQEKDSPKLLITIRSDEEKGYAVILLETGHVVACYTIWEAMIEAVELAAGV